MNHAQVTIIHHSNSIPSVPTISISNNVLKQLQIPTDQPLRFLFSNKTYQVICQKRSTVKTNIIKVDASFAAKLCLPEHTQLHLSYNPQSYELRLGPVFAILVSGLSKEDPPFAPLNAFCEEVIRIAKQRHILAYVVTLPELSKEDDTVEAWTFNHNRWKKERLPYPQVVYNRIPTKRIEETTAFTQLKNKFSKQNIHLFNQTFLNKWEVHETLKESKELDPYLPDTHLFKGPLTFKSMIEQYPVTFIKPVHGSLGRKIYRISRKINGFQSQYSTPNGQIEKYFGRISQLYSFLSKRVNPKKNIIQQGIPLLTLNGRAIDFRALMHKNKLGEWTITSMVARIGSENRFVSNIARGGALSKVGAVLKRCKVSQPNTVKKNLLLVARKSCDVLEKNNKGHFGELGIDLAVSQSGQIYILEINSKPSKTEDSIFSSHTKGRPSVHRLLDYTLYLSMSQIN
jgi:glutathione synthase/RimK-type ligase-like ATP-grasp enzyme